MSQPEPSGLKRIPIELRRNFSGVRARLFFYAVLILLLGIGVTIFTMRQILITQLDSRVEKQLAQEAREFQTLAGGINPKTGKPFGGKLKPLFNTFFQRNVLAPEEQLLTFVGGRPFRVKTPQVSANQAGIEDFDPALLELWRAPASSISGDATTTAGEVRYLATPVRANNEVRGSFVVAYLVDPDQAEIDDAVRVAALVGLAALLIGSLVAYLAAGRVLQPLSELTDTARSIEESDLTRRITVKGDDELAELGTTFNSMLDRLETSFGDQRELIRNVNHELRTPITIVRGHLELIEEDPAERAATIELVTGELDRMSLLVDDLLTLAKSERSDFLKIEPVEVYPLLDDLLFKAGALGDRTWKLNVVDDPGVAMIDRQRITQAMLNLIDNAVRQTDPGQIISVGGSREPGALRLWVADEGPGIDPADRQRLFERFERGKTGRRYSGTGLGLAIVKAVAEAHGGTVEAGNSDFGGARFTIVIPAASNEQQTEGGRS